MSSIRARKENGLLYFDFTFRNHRCREQTALPDTRANRQLLQRALKKIDAEITLGTFEYRKFFPNSRKAAIFDSPSGYSDPVEAPNAPNFADFTAIWLDENMVRWRHSTQVTNTSTIKRHLLPAFGSKVVSDISKADVLAFRSALAKVPGRNGNATLSAKTINHTMGVLSMILTEAADRYQFSNPMLNVKRLSQPKKDIHPFSLDQVQLILRSVREDFRDYFVVRFFTGMRTGEIHGLKWKYVDFDNRKILVRETFSKGRTEYTKTDGSQREVDMSQPVYDALRRQAAVTQGRSEYVFCTRANTPLDTKNVTDRVWYPLLRYLGLERRRPYQCRHTAATLWLAAGENPEWIARQLGHTTTEMLFRVYSRFVPNLTRRDGSAFDRFLAGALDLGETHADAS